MGQIAGEKNNNFSYVLSQEQANMVVDLDNGNHRVHEFTNSVLHNHNKNLQRDGIQRDKLSCSCYQNEYLKAPLTVMSELREYLSSPAMQYDVPVQTTSGNVEEDNEVYEEMLCNEDILDDKKDMVNMECLP